MGGARKLWILLAAAACAAVLVSCGGDDDSTTGTGTAAESATQPPGQPGGAGGGQESKGSNGGGGAGGGGDSSGGDSSGQGSAPVEGERSATFRTPGGDNSIQEFGEEAGAALRAEAKTSIDALYRAIESGDWAVICAKYLSTNSLEQIKTFAEQSPQVKGLSCAEILGRLNQVGGNQTPGKPRAGVASVRIEGDTAFAIWRGIDGKGYAIPLTLEDGVWKLTGLAPTPLQVPVGQ